MTSLSLNDNLIRDINPLTGLPGLEFLNLAGNFEIPCSALNALVAELVTTIIEQPLACVF